MKKPKTPYDYSLFVDCGAPSLYNELSRKTKHKGIMGTSFSERKYDDYSYIELPEYKKYRDKYIEFLLEHKNSIDTYSNLDVINNPKATWENQQIMEDAGLSPIPVFHLGNNEKWLKFYIDKYEYIALGGLVPNPTSTLIPILDRLFKEYILDSNGNPKVKVHGFACTSLPLMLRFPWHSVDSATCRKLAAYGSIAIPINNNSKITTISVSSRDVPLEKKVTPGLLKVIDLKCKKYNTSIKILSESGIERTVWNHLVHLDCISAKEKPVRFHFAGSMSKEETDTFWKRLLESNVLSEQKHRLGSFYYQKETLHMINLKPINYGK